MKKIVLIFIIFVSSLVAKDINVVDNIKLFKTDNFSLNTHDIKQYTDKFKEIDAKTVFDDKNVSYWLEVKLKDKIKDGAYIGYFIGFDILQSSINLKRFHVGDIKHFKFLHKDINDSSIYFQIKPNSLIKEIGVLDILSELDYLSSIDDSKMMQFIIGIVIGVIFMAIIYNFGFFYFTKEKVFLYYSLMQVFIIFLVLFSSSHQFLSILHTLVDMDKSELINMTATLFFILFSREFFDTAKFTPKIDKILLVYLAIVGIDIVFTFISHSVILSDVPYSPFLLLLIVVGIIRLSQGFKPAYFYLGGWVVMIFSVAIMEFFDDSLSFNTILIGSAIEAIMLSFAISYKFKLLKDESEQHRQIIIQQSKLASMGEMLGNIAHQWRQPLTRLSYIFMNIEEIDNKKELRQKISEGTTQLEFMSKTIDEFRDFYAPNKKKELFSIAKESQNAIDIMYDTLIDLGIECKLIVKEDIEVKNYKNQFAQVLINLLSNAKDAHIANKTQKPIITVRIDKNSITIEDNAGGIDSNIMYKIFEPYFTTKQSHGGIGLYMSKMIVEKNMGGKLDVKNSSLGAVFSIEIG